MGNIDAQAKNKSKGGERIKGMPQELKYLTRVRDSNVGQGAAGKSADLGSWLPTRPRRRRETASEERDRDVA